MTEYAPVGVVTAVEIVRVEVHVGLQVVTVKDAVAPEGSPEAERFTACVVPAVIAAVTVVAVDCPGDTAADGGFREMEKSNDEVPYWGRGPVYA